MQGWLGFVLVWSGPLLPIDVLENALICDSGSQIERRRLPETARERETDESNENDEMAPHEFLLRNDREHSVGSIRTVLEQFVPGDHPHANIGNSGACRQLPVEVPRARGQAGRDEVEGQSSIR